MSTPKTNNPDESVPTLRLTFSAVIHGIPLVLMIILGMDPGMRAVNLPPEESIFHLPSPKVLEVADFTSHRSFRNAYLYRIQRVSICQTLNARGGEFILVKYHHAWVTREPRWLIAERTCGRSRNLFALWPTRGSAASHIDGPFHDNILLASSLNELERLRGIPTREYKVLRTEDFLDLAEQPTIATLGKILVSIHAQSPASLSSPSLRYAQSICDDLKSLASPFDSCCDETSIKVLLDTKTP